MNRPLTPRVFYKSVLRDVPLMCRREGGEGPAVKNFLW